jgi:hypothetical protein
MIADIDKQEARTLQHYGQVLGASRGEASERIERCVLREKDDDRYAHPDTPCPCCDRTLVSNFAFLVWMRFCVYKVCTGFAGAAEVTLHHPRR